ncbi:hypothetical protein [Streptomyces scopuliridis]|uniref:hypothetical protein n=1 Tax=Streptomyces scopuliridis TaxID=452529 RepID=UPI00342A8AB2
MSAGPDRLAADLAATASQLARETVPDSDVPRTLYMLATAVGALAAPVGRLGGAHRPEAQAAIEALRTAERALHTLQRAHTPGPQEDGAR